jgi:hypothetical protein
LQDKDLREAAALLQQALNAETVQQEEALWTQVSKLAAAAAAAAEQNLRQMQKALIAETMEQEEALWTQVTGSSSSSSVRT